MDVDLEKAKLVIDALSNVGTVTLLTIFVVTLWQAYVKLADRIIGILERKSEVEGDGK